MIREITNFTKDLIADIPDVLQWKIEPSKGLHIFVSLDENGGLIKRRNYGSDYYYYREEDNNAINSKLIAFENEGKRVGTTMNKVLDKKKQIFSCSPYIVSFKKKSLKIEGNKGYDIDKIVKLIPDYLEYARNFTLTDESLIQLSKAFEVACISVLKEIDDYVISQLNKDGTTTNESIFEKMKDEEYVNLYLGNLPIERYKEAHEKYLTEKLFNDNKYNDSKEIKDDTYGFSNFLNSLNSKKPYVEHKTSCEYIGISNRIQAKEARLLNEFEILIINGTLPNPLPIIVDKREFNKQCVKLFNEENALSYREILVRLFAKENIKELPNYYLLNYTKRKSIIINDFDFVPLFRYEFEPKVTIENVTETGSKKDSVFEKDKDIIIHNIFDFERVVVREIFNNSLVKIKEEKYAVKYFGDIDPNYVSGGDMIFQLIMKYRKAFYDYIYKSKTSAINSLIFDDIMYVSILSNIMKDEIKGRFDWNYTIKQKINIWFSLYNLFNNNKSTKIMASKVTDMMSKMRSVVKGESILETPEEFAFGAGQIVSYLIDRSAASDKTYALLEPYLQKTKSNLLQDAIAQTISVYKHDISTYKGAFQSLASNVLTYDGGIDVKPLLKYFLAGCFCTCVIYDKKEKQ
jgi:CRISPR-associated protein Csh1